MKYKLYKAVLKHDKGESTVLVTALNKKEAINRILKTENCPLSAIKSLK